MGKIFLELFPISSVYIQHISVPDPKRLDQLSFIVMGGIIFIDVGETHLPKGILGSVNISTTFKMSSIIFQFKINISVNDK